VRRELRIVPEPTPEEREAIERTLPLPETEPAAYRSAWRRSGLPGRAETLPPEDPAEV
jgi:hypothetical protein